ncbi:TetR/AcrR family transcriptional regulator [Citricoccus nitrophenolicus]|uniref:TetR/AcrR family transcriptional regulator n=1 Tax=Citricoccus nitrophenolicus TaxID=863575 RepID=UPI0031E5FD06
MTTEQTARATAKADRRQALLQAAAHLFAERGYTSVRLEDLGAACGISGPGVYRHFPGKNSVLGELLLQVSRDLLGGAQQVVAREGTAHGTLTALVRFQAEFAVAHRDVIAVQDREMRHLQAQARAEVVRLQRAYIGLWAGELVRAHPDEDHDTAVFRAQAAFGLLNSTPHSVRRSPAEQSGRSTLLERMALAALLAGPVDG